MPNTFQDFEEFLQLLNDNEVQYLVVGGYAFAVHAFPRFTNDLDIWIAANESNANRVLKVLQDFGFQELDVTIDDLIAPDKIIQIGYPPLRIDIMTSIDGVTFEDAWEQKVIGMYGKQSMSLISREHLIRNKRASGRKKDLRDLDDLDA